MVPGKNQIMKMLLATSCKQPRAALRCLLFFLLLLGATLAGAQGTVYIYSGPSFTPGLCPATNRLFAKTGIGAGVYWCPAAQGPWTPQSASGVFPHTFTAVPSNWLNSYNSSTGAFTATQPAYSDISGAPTLAVTIAPVTSKWVNSYNSSTGAFTATQPAYSDISGAPTLAVTIAPVTSKWVNSYNSSTGAFTATQPAYSDISGAPTLAATIAPVTSKWVNSYNSSTGAFTATQPAYSDISGAPTLAVTIAPVTSKWVNSYNSSTGAFTATQPAYSDISGAPTLAATIAPVTSKWVNSYNSSTGAFTATQPAYSDISGAPPAPPASSISIAQAAMPGSINLTAEGTQDWMIWGNYAGWPRNAGYSSWYPSALNRKQFGGNQLDMWSTAANGIGSVATSAYPTTSWSAGDAIDSSTSGSIFGTASFIYLIPGTNYSGIFVSSPCDTFQRVLRAYSDVVSSDIYIRYYSTDGSIALGNTSGTSTVAGQYTVTYNCSNDGGHLELFFGNSSSQTSTQRIAVITLGLL